MKLILEVENDTKPLNGDVLVYNGSKGKYVVKPMSYLYQERDKRFIVDEKEIAVLKTDVVNLKKYVNKLAEIIKEMK